VQDSVPYILQADEIEAVIRDLFSTAKINGGVNYVFTLVRLEGVTCTTDPLIVLRRALSQMAPDISDEQASANYCFLTSNEASHELIANLLNCALKRPYSSVPFLHLYAGTFPNVVLPDALRRVKDLCQLATEADKLNVAKLIQQTYIEEVLTSYKNGGPIPSSSLVQSAFKNCLTLMNSLLNSYFAERLTYKTIPKLYKMPNFEVLELLVNNEDGLFGFNVHFSNGQRSTFFRTPDSTECVNINPGPPLEVDVGIIDELRDEWWIGNKRLYEIGLPGRYNKLGEWKPLLYRGKWDELSKFTESYSKNTDVQGCNFYMLCTGHKVIEFVVRTNIEFPSDSFQIGGHFHFWKCEPLAGCDPGIKLYDCWVEVEEASENEIKRIIAMISVVVNRLVFPFNGTSEWRLKYNSISNTKSVAMPSQEDIQLLDSMLTQFPKTQDAIVLDAAIDWYNHGRSARNIFTAFLCYYIAFESVAIAVAEGDADFNLNCPHENGMDSKNNKTTCIQEKFRLLYATDPMKFIKESYLECIVSLKARSRLIAERVFGVEHEHVRSLFENGTDGHSLSDIRGKLAHGVISLLSDEDEVLVGNRLHEMMSIAHEFLNRLIFSLKPDEPLPTWSGMHVASMSFADPRMTMVATPNTKFPNTDWKIRSEWLD
jgi:hypothetical protein